ncbi:MAG: glucosyl-3-phosphoglycerate synthase [Actinomycetota bacterium]|nr:glucosyl-3-phosphoglycerate synthase [Actinomycetota bacterium]
MDEKWLSERTFDHRDFADLELLARKKADLGLSVSVCLPTLNVAATLGPILDGCRALKETGGLIDQLAIVDSCSTDATVPIALAAGAEVFLDRDILPGLAPAGGKGEALWKSLAVLTGDIIIWIDSDIANFHPRFVYGLLGPLLNYPEIGYVKAFYRRPLLLPAGARQENEGGRVTEICVRPLLNFFWPPLANLVQPLSGESAARREVLESLPFFTDYAVEVGLLIHVLRRFGLSTIAQVNLDERVHTNQPLQKLGRMSFAILQAVFKLLEDDGLVTGNTSNELRESFRLEDGVYMPVSERIQIIERPPFKSLDATGAAGFKEKV